VSDDLVHGGALDAMRRAFPDAPEPWVDLSTGINPRPYPLDAITGADWTRLPTIEARRTCAHAMATAFGADVAAILPVPGSEIAIRLLPLVLGAASVAIVSPTYGDHARAWTAAGRTVVAVPTLEAALDTRAGAIVLCNPNNPDGRTVSPDMVCAAADVQAARGGWMVVDEAFAEVASDLSIAARAGMDGLVVLRSFGKFYGLAGLRLAALLGSAGTLDAMAMLLGGWSVSGPALKLGSVAYADEDWRRETLDRLARETAALDAVLAGNGLTVAGGTPLFRFVAVGDAHRRWAVLAAAGIYVRRFADPPDRLRIGLPAGPAALARLAAALESTP
jgi:cobalamin biosynthetic protein CobC